MILTETPTGKMLLEVYHLNNLSFKHSPQSMRDNLSRAELA